MSKPLKLQISKEQLQAIQSQGKQISEYYYTKDAAQFAKRILDQLHENRLPVRIRPEGYKLSTLRVQFYQGAKYLMDNEDPTGKYKAWYRITRCSTSSNQFMEFKIRGMLQEHTIETVIPWRDQFTDYLDKATPGKKLGPLDVSLSLADLEWIEGQLAGLVKPNGDPMFIAQVEVGKPLLLIRDND